MEVEEKVESQEVQDQEQVSDESVTDQQKPETPSKTLEEQVEALTRTLQKTNKSNRELEANLKKVTKEKEDLASKIKILEDQVKNNSSDKESHKKIQQLQEQLELKQEEFDRKISAIQEQHARATFESQVAQELQAEGAEYSTMDFLKFSAQKFYNLQKLEDGSFDIVIRDDAGNTERWEKSTASFVKHNIKDLVLNMKNSANFAGYFKVKVNSGVNTSGAVNRQGNTQNVSLAAKKKELQQRYAEADKNANSAARLKVLAEAVQLGIPQREIESSAN